MEGQREPGTDHHGIDAESGEKPEQDGPEEMGVALDVLAGVVDEAEAGVRIADVTQRDEGIVADPGAHGRRYRAGHEQREDQQEINVASTHAGSKPPAPPGAPY